MSRKLSQSELAKKLTGARHDFSSRPGIAFLKTLGVAVATSLAIGLANAPSTDSDLIKSSKSVFGIATNTATQQTAGAAADFKKGLPDAFDYEALNNGAAPLPELIKTALEHSDSRPPIADIESSWDFFKTPTSGVYSNPLDPSQKLTVLFTYDENAKENIEHDVGKFNVSEDDYSQHMKKLSKWNSRNQLLSGNPLAHYFKDTKQSVHIGIDGDDDMNLVQVNRFDLLPDGFGGGQFYKDYWILLHEATHALPLQAKYLQQAFDASTPADIRLKTKIELENEADTVATIKLAQRMFSDGASQDNVLQAVDILITSRKTTNSERVLKKGDASTHMTTPALMVVKELIEQEPDLIKSLSNDEIVALADSEAQAAVDTDYKPYLQKQANNFLSQADPNDFYDSVTGTTYGDAGLVELLKSTVGYERFPDDSLNAQSERIGEIIDWSTQLLIAHQGDELLDDYAKDRAADFINQKMGYSSQASATPH